MVKITMASWAEPNYLSKGGGLTGGATSGDSCPDCAGTGGKLDSDGSLTGLVGSPVACDCTGYVGPYMAAQDDAVRAAYAAGWGDEEEDHVGVWGPGPGLGEAA